MPVTLEQTNGLLYLHTDKLNLLICSQEQSRWSKMKINQKSPAWQEWFIYALWSLKKQNYTLEREVEFTIPLVIWMNQENWANYSKGPITSNLPKAAMLTGLAQYPALGGRFPQVKGIFVPLTQGCIVAAASAMKQWIGLGPKWIITPDELHFIWY